jgi:hypothetical protein
MPAVEMAGLGSVPLFSFPANEMLGFRSFAWFGRHRKPRQIATQVPISHS